ncbi:hypothetical protein [Nitrospira sp. Nam74]
MKDQGMKRGKEQTAFGLFSLGLCGRGASRFDAGLQALNVLCVFPTDLPVFLTSSRHHIPPI